MNEAWVTQMVTDVDAATDGFSGVVLVEHQGDELLAFAGGMADRAESRPITLKTKLATASATKGFTALAVVSMIDEGIADFDTTLVDVLGAELTAVDPSVTLEQLLGHTSGAGDYLDEDQIESDDDYVLDVAVHMLAGPTDYLPLLNRHPQVEPPGTRFRYNNGGFVMLANVIERLGRDSYHDEVRRRVFQPAGLTETDFHRSDQLPTGVALGYLGDGRTNVHHLPVIGTGDGGAYTTGRDMIRFWDALFEGRIVSPEMVRRMTSENHRAQLDCNDDKNSYGLGFWIGADRATVLLEGNDAGVSLWSGANPESGLSFCLIANNSTDVWPVARIINRHLVGS